MKRIIIVGATSGIGEGLARRYAETPHVKIGLIGRREALLEKMRAARPDVYEYAACDLTDVDRLKEVLDGLAARLGGLDMLVLSAGTGDLNPSLDFETERPALDLNVMGWTFTVDWAVHEFERQGAGHLVAITSAGGLRGNGTAPAYSATKAFQMNYLEGIRQRAVARRIPMVVTDVRPGFVDTAMAKGEGLFWVAPVEKAVGQIVRALERKRNVVYVTRRWRWVAWVWKRIPDFLFMKMGADVSR